MNHVIADSQAYAGWAGLVALDILAASDARDIDRPHVLAARHRLLLLKEDTPSVEPTAPLRTWRIPRQVGLIHDPHGTVLQVNGVSRGARQIARRHDDRNARDGSQGGK
jgi:hypothetical protein